VGDAYDNAAAETVMGLFKNEAVAKDSPFRTGALKTETDVMEIVFEWVHWYNNARSPGDGRLPARVRESGSTAVTLAPFAA
jgi:transposase InsO family protein